MGNKLPSEAVDILKIFLGLSIFIHIVTIVAIATS